MASIDVRKLEAPTDTDIDRVSKLLEVAFEGDAFVAACIGGDESLHYAFQHATMAAVAIGGEIYVASHKGEDVAGVAGWFPPGRDLFDDGDEGPQMKAGFHDFLFKKSPPELNEWWLTYFLPKYETQAKMALGENVKLDAWFLQMFGVLPEHQDQGVGGSLVKAVEAKAQAEGKLVCIEAATPRTCSIYQHWGYELKSEEWYESPAGGFNFYILIKDPSK